MSNRLSLRKDAGQFTAGLSGKYQAIILKLSFTMFGRLMQEK
ncbi:hypothetical protein N035_015155 [Klebsiella pneumoniae EGD-HP19-C]|nr:hypothetical protein N035_015155 [Klebsiella pneumoniae EGD-HP19-C]